MIEFRTLRGDELDAWGAHCQGVFTADRDGYFRDHFLFDPAADFRLVFVAVDEGAIVSTVRVFDRTVWLGGRAVHMGGIGEVSTKEAYRRQGLAGRLLEMAIGAMVSRGMEISILFGSQRLYHAMGWRACETEWVGASAEALPGEIAVRPFCEDELPLLMGLYDLYAGRMNGAVLRSEAYWRRWVLPQCDRFHVICLADVPIGYCVPTRKEDALVVDELCVLPGKEAAMEAAVRGAARLFGKESVRVRRALLPGLSGERLEPTRSLMVRLNTEMEGISDSDALVRAMGDAAGMCFVDGF